MATSALSPPCQDGSVWAELRQSLRRDYGGRTLPGDVLGGQILMGARSGILIAFILPWLQLFFFSAVFAAQGASAVDSVGAWWASFTTRPWPQLAEDSGAMIMVKFIVSGMIANGVVELAVTGAIQQVILAKHGVPKKRLWTWIGSGLGLLILLNPAGSIGGYEVPFDMNLVGIGWTFALRNLGTAADALANTRLPVSHS